MILSALLGTGTGLLGSLATNIFNLFTQKQKNKHEIELIKARIDEKRVENELQIQSVQIQANISREKADADIYALSQKYGNQTAAPSELIAKLFDSPWTMPFGALITFLLGLVDVVRAAIRPGVTIVLILMVGYMGYQNYEIIQQNTTMVTALEIGSYIDQIIYMTFSVVSWWFGDRRMAKFTNRLDDGNKRH